MFNYLRQMFISDIQAIMLTTITAADIKLLSKSKILNISSVYIVCHT